MGTAPRHPVLDLPAYRPGRTPADVGAGRGLPDPLARLAANESPFGPLPAVVRVMEENLGSINRYPEVRSSSLRTAVARWLGIEPSQVAIGPGSAGLLWQIAQVFLDEHSQMVTAWPSFEAYPIVAQLMGAELVRTDLAGQVVDVEAMASAVTERTKLVVIAEPNNPTGTAVGPPAIERLVSATRGRCILVIDEAYLEFSPLADRRRSVELALAHDHVIVLRTFSKAHGLAGLRVGYAVTTPQLVDLLDRVAPPFAVSSLAQVAAAATLDAIDELDQRVAEVTAERDRVIAGLRRLGLDVPATATNFVWIPCGHRARRWAAELERRDLITRAFPGWGVRITVGEAAENDRVVAALAELAGPGMAMKEVAPT
jgi:histidinol-phosphate aminotransferase